MNINSIITKEVQYIPDTSGGADGRRNKKNLQIANRALKRSNYEKETDAR